MTEDKTHHSVSSLAERVSKTEQKTKHLDSRLSGLKEQQSEHSKVINSHTTEIQVQKVDISNKFESIVAQLSLSSDSMNSLRASVDMAVLAVNNIISSKQGADKTKALIAKIILGIISAGGIITGIVLGILKYTG